MIPKERFLKALNKYPPNGLILFVYKYFSKDTKKEDQWLNKYLTIFFVSLFLLGFLFVAINNQYIAGIITSIFTICLVSFGVFLLLGVFMNIYRIHNIKKYLGVTTEEYNKMVDEFSINK